ncbi:MAG TPA: endonuclease/exonuclease/phosphatase family protein [Kofleriaceae bacterium]|nr:endonuclease/exonuclease/phosphatase family protein [Kofleriaceae bacterium]
MRRLRAMTYNIHRGRGVDRKLDLGRIAAVIASFDPDVVALQEVDIGRKRSGRVDQAAELASRLGMEMVFAPNIEYADGERYGMATLTRLPLRSSRQIKLPQRYRSEPRSSLITVLGWGEEHVVELVNTHLSILFKERPGQVAALAAEMASEALIVAGDFNMTPWSPAYRALRHGSFLHSATRFARTWPAPAPLVPLDHILYRGEVELVHGKAWLGGPARTASDHLPVVIELLAR